MEEMGERERESRVEGVRELEHPVCTKQLV